MSIEPPIIERDFISPAAAAAWSFVSHNTLGDATEWYLIAAWTQPFYHTRILIETGISLLKQAVDDINNPLPIAIYGVGVGKLRTYSVRTRRSVLEKALRKMKKSGILFVEGGPDFRVESALESYISAADACCRARR